METVRASKVSKVIRTYFDSSAVKNIDKSRLKVLILVSVVGNKYCEDDFFKATMIEAITQFKEITFLIVDSLQQYNEEAKTVISFPEVVDDTFEKKAIALGDQWFQRNIDAFISTELQSKLDFKNNTSLDEAVKITNRLFNLGEINFNILRWNEWIKLGCDKCNYEEKKQLLMEQFKVNEQLKLAFETDQEAFVSRYSDNKDVWRKASECFLQEEVPAVEFISAGLGYNVVGYAGKQLATFKEVEKAFIIGNYPHFLGWVGIFFKKYKVTENSGWRKSLDMLILMEEFSSLIGEEDRELVFAATCAFFNCLHNINNSLDRNTITEDTARFVVTLIKFLKEKDEMNNEDFQSSVENIKRLMSNKCISHKNNIENTCLEYGTSG